jgi:hypothetical protein
VNWTDPHHREVEGDRREGLGLARRALWLARFSHADAHAYAYAEFFAAVDKWALRLCLKCVGGAGSVPAAIAVALDKRQEKTR